MIYIKPSFWQKKSFTSFLLLPLTLVTFCINFVKKFNIKKHFKIKIICVGNLSVGGTGKTSLAVELNKLLSTKFKTVFIKKKYANQKDEYNLLKGRGKTISSKNRIDALKIAEKNFDLAILDDGLQQKNIKYDLKIVCINSFEGFGNNFLLPAGPLRESINKIKNYDIAFINGEKSNNNLYLKLKSINKKLQIFEGKYKAVNLKTFNLKKKYLMFCGIGNPHEFEQILVKNKFLIKEKIIYPDHYKIPNEILNKLKLKARSEDLAIVTTEKDFFRLNNSQRKNIKFLKISLRIKDIKKFKKLLISKL